jgi:hypothetical protein
MNQIKMTIKELQKLDKKGRLNTPEAKEMALEAYEKGFPPHTCYWNDRFYIAVKADLPENYRNLAAHKSMQNGINGYFETRTHFGFDMIKLLEDLGFEEPQIKIKEKNIIYYSLESEVIKFIQDKFKCPSPKEVRELESKIQRK